MRCRTRIQAMRGKQAKPCRVLKLWVGAGGYRRPEKSPQERVTFKLHLRAIDSRKTKHTEKHRKCASQAREVKFPKENGAVGKCL